MKNASNFFKKFLLLFIVLVVGGSADDKQEKEKNVLLILAYLPLFFKKESLIYNGKAQPKFSFFCINLLWLPFCFLFEMHA